MEIPSTMQKAASATVAVAKGIRPEQFQSPTPCTEWNVQQLLNHLIGSLDYFKARGEGLEASPPQPAPPSDFEHTIEHLESAAMSTAQAWQRPGALDQKLKFGPGEMPGSVMASLALSEMLTHTWDLAKATGQTMPANDIEVDGVLRTLQQTLKPEARQPAFGPEITPPHGAQSIDRLAAFLGRQP